MRGRDLGAVVASLVWVATRTGGVRAVAGAAGVLTAATERIEIGARVRLTAVGPGTAVFSRKERQTRGLIGLNGVGTVHGELLTPLLAFVLAPRLTRGEVSSLSGDSPVRKGEVDGVPVRENLAPRRKEFREWTTKVLGD